MAEAVNTQSKVVPIRTALSALNHPLLRRIFLVSAVEEIVEFDIVNATVKVKIIDKIKVAKMKKEVLLPSHKRTITDKKYALGRLNTLKLTIVLAMINASEDLKTRLLVPKGFEVQLLQMYGTNLTVHSVSTIARIQRDNSLQEDL